ncbi:hypothetical protein LCGC14_2835180 [marine sediment metagenome]|uniref:Uncharacterized protein n=1 Tax=marine sediment metagenome TaxID=412755 RepID=A0A0F8YD10_9ZZZZ
MSTGDFTVKTVDTANGLLLAGSKVYALITALELIQHDIPHGRTHDIIELAKHHLGATSQDLITEGTYLGDLK